MSKTSFFCNKALRQRLLIRLIIVVVAILFVYYLAWPLVKMLSPFIAAGIFAKIFSPLIRWIYSKVRIPKKLLAFLLVIGFLILVFLPFYFIIREGVTQINNMATRINEYEPPDITAEPNEGFSWIKEVVPGPMQEWLQNTINTVTDYFKEGSTGLVRNVLRVSGSVVSQVAYIGLWIFTFFMSFYFILAEYQRITEYAASLLSKSSRRRFGLLKDTTIAAVAKYLKGAINMSLFCFIFMLLVFGVSQHPYAILLSLGLALVDFLPIVGAMTVLVPWCAYELILGDQSYGIFLLVINIIYFGLRRIIEPKIMGNATGLHPLVTLITIYVGAQINGVWGAIAAPIVTVLIISLYQTGLFNDWILDFYEFRACLRVFLKRSSKRGSSGKPLNKNDLGSKTSTTDNSRAKDVNNCNPIDSDPNEISSDELHRDNGNVDDASQKAKGYDKTQASSDSRIDPQTGDPIMGKELDDLAKADDYFEEKHSP